MSKENKTNAMRFLEAHRIAYRPHLYQCDEFIDGVSVARLAGQPCAQTFKTLVAHGKPHCFYVFAIPVDRELDFKKAARAVGEKSVELLPVKEINAVTGYIRGGCTVIGMKKQFPTTFHRSALDFETIFLSGGRLGVQIEVSPQAVAAAIDARFEDILMG